MAGIIYELIDILNYQKECFDGLYTLAQYKEQAIIQKDLELITEIVKKEEEFIGRVNNLDKKREGLLKDIAIVIRISPKDIKLSDIIDKIGKDNEAANKLSLLRQELMDKTEKLKKQNEINSMLINQSLEFVNFTINALEGLRGSVQTSGYGKPGENISVESRSFFDKKQ
jgi:flagellar biosynthesis/type III secretory pathway chaperone